MSLHSRTLSSQFRAPGPPRASIAPGGGGGSSPALAARIEEKKAELANLKDLKDLSAQMVEQMEALQEKMSTLSNGTEAIALVMSNWHNVLRAIQMASSKLPVAEESPALPHTLVRIPTEHAPAIQERADDALAENEP